MRLALLTVLALMLTSCGGSDSPTEPTCANISGGWVVTLADSCGTAGSGLVAVIQSGVASLFKPETRRFLHPAHSRETAARSHTSRPEVGGANGNGSLSVNGARSPHVHGYVHSDRTGLLSAWTLHGVVYFLAIL